MQIERVERQALADAQTFALVGVLTGQQVDVPDVYSARRDFDKWLCSEPETIDPDRDALLTALGLR